jgi:ribosomal protein S18 acetylase RimI-like enzyme
MTRNDKPAIMQILRATPEFKPEEVIVAEEVIDCYLGDPASGYHMLVAEASSVVAGYVCFGTTPLTEGTWDIYWIAVAPDKQGQRIGSALMGAAETGIRQAGGRLAIIETSSLPSYARTRDFYSRHNYEIVARIPDFYAPGDDKLILLKRLR